MHTVLPNSHKFLYNLMMIAIWRCVAIIKVFVLLFNAIRITEARNQTFQPAFASSTNSILTATANPSENVFNRMFTFAGGGEYVNTDISAKQALIKEPTGLAKDVNNGAVYISDFKSGCILKVLDDIIANVAGICNNPDNRTTDGVAATSTPLNMPFDVAVDSTGVIYISEFGAMKIRKLTTNGILFTLVGTGESDIGGGESGTSAVIGLPFAVWVSNAGRIYFSVFSATFGSSCLYYIGVEGNAVLFAGTADGTFDDGFAATSTQFAGINHLAGDSSGRIIFTDGQSIDYGNHVKAISGSDRMVSTLIGTGNWSYNGEGLAATSTDLMDPQGVAIDEETGNVYVSNYDGSRVQVLRQSVGQVFTVAGDGGTTEGVEGGAASSGCVVNPHAVLFDNDRWLYMTDSGYGKVRRVLYSWSETLPPTESPTVSIAPSTSRPSVTPTIEPTELPTIMPTSPTFKPSRFPTLKPSFRPSKVSRFPSVVRTAVPTRSRYNLMFTVAGGGSSNGTNIPARQAQLRKPSGLAKDIKSGAVYISELGGGCVRKVVNNIIIVVAGVCGRPMDGSVDGAMATASFLKTPLNVAVDSTGVVYISDSDAYTVKKVTTDGVLSSAAGYATWEYESIVVDDDSSTTAPIGSPLGLWVNREGRLYFSALSFTGFNYLYYVNPMGEVVLYAGSKSGVFDDGFTATSTQFAGINHLAGDSSGRIIFGDGSDAQHGNHVKAISGSDLVVSTLIGTGNWNYNGEGTHATATDLKNPQGVAIDEETGNVYVSNYDGSRVQVLRQSVGQVFTVAGDGGTTEGVEGGAASSGCVVNPHAVLFDNDRWLYMTDSGYGKVRRVLYSWSETLPPTESPTVSIAPTTLMPTAAPTYAVTAPTCPTEAPVLSPLAIPSGKPAEYPYVAAVECQWPKDDDLCDGTLQEVVVSSAVSSTHSKKLGSITTITTTLKRTLRKKKTT